MSEKGKPTAEEIQRERAITQWNLYRVVQRRILNTFNDPRTLKPKYYFTPEVEEKKQRIMRYAQEALPFLIPLPSEEMCSDSYQPSKVKLTWRQRLMSWERMAMRRQGPDGTFVFTRVSWRDTPRLVLHLPGLLMLFSAVLQDSMSEWRDRVRRRG